MKSFSAAFNDPIYQYTYVLTGGLEFDFIRFKLRQCNNRFKSPGRD